MIESAKVLIFFKGSSF